MSRLNPSVRRALSSILRPPAGLRLDAAVGTSFTLDLRTLLAVPLTFALLDGVDFDIDAGSPDETPAAPVLLGALLAYARRMRVICDARYVSVPATPSRLYSLLEPSIRPIVVPAGAHFHPKLWLLRFVDDQEAVSHRLVVSTRNLTEDRSWDLVVVLDEDHAGVAGIAEPAAELLREAAPGDELVQDVATRAASARFLPPAGCHDLRIHAWGAGEGADPLLGRRGRKMLVVSPFIGLERLTTLARQSDELTVVSRPETLNRLAHGSTLPPANLRRLMDLSADDDGLSGELHAKLVVLDEPGGRSRWWLGSLNATDNGVRRNAEALVELTMSTSAGGVDALLATDSDRLGALLERHTIRPPDDDDDNVATERRLRQAIAAAKWTVVVRENGDGQLCAELTVDWPHHGPGADVVVRVRFASGRPGGRVRLDATVARATARWSVALEDVTSLLEVQVELPEVNAFCLLVVADLEVPDVDARLAALFNAVAPDTNVMLRLILLLLTSGHDAGSASAAARALIESPDERTNGVPSLALLEEMVRTYARDPDRLRRTGDVIAGLPRDHPTTAPLRELWDTFAEALRAKR